MATKFIKKESLKSHQHQHHHKDDKCQKNDDRHKDDERRCDLDLETCTKASFAQVLIPLVDQPGQFTPAFSQIGNDITALLRLRFAPDFRKICYKLYVFDATRNDNKVIAVDLAYGAANVNGPPLVRLFLNEQGQKSDGFLTKGIVKNIDIAHFSGAGNPANQINSVASLYAAIRQGNIYFIVFTQLMQGGAARGQIYL